MQTKERQDLWDYLDANDILEIVQALQESIPFEGGTAQDGGYSEALCDVLHAANLDATGVRLNAVREHFEHWSGAVATDAHDHGYCNAIDDMLNSVAKLIAQRY